MIKISNRNSINFRAQKIQRTKIPLVILLLEMFPERPTKVES